MTRIKIVKLNPKAILPEYQSQHSSGMDLHACIDGPITIQPGKRVLIPTGLSIELPAGYESQVRSRSGLALKYGVSMANGVGTIDADYRGEYGVLLINLGEDPFIVEPEMRVAQLVISRYEKIIWAESTELSQTDRGAGGFGSTGL